MKNIKMGLFCLVLSAVASQAMAMSGGHEPSNRHYNQHHNTDGNQDAGPTASVPEPSSLAMIVAGIVGIVVARRFTK